MIAAASLLAASCTDFDDYNEAYTDGNPQSTQTLWDNISSNGKLTQFAEILKKVGYDKELQNTRFYTVWAPEDGTYNSDSLLNTVNNDMLLNRFVNSHIANYNFPLSAMVDENVHTLNKKSFALAGNGVDYTYDGMKVNQRNIPNINGVLHTIDGYALFLPSIYENIMDTTKADVDSIRKIFTKYENSVLDLENSVEGAIDEDGNQTYMDSVMIVTNALTSDKYLAADIAEEDSNYLMLIPNNDAYIKAYDEIKKCFNYAASTEMWTPTKAIANPDKPVAVETPAGLGDSLVIRNILTNGVFNNNDFYNRWVDDPTDINKSDTLRTTRYNKLSNAPELLSHTVGAPQKMSNGTMRVVDEVAYLPWETYNPELNVNIFNPTYRCLVENIAGTDATSGVGFLDANGDLTDRNSSNARYAFRYLDLIGSDEFSNPRAYFYVNGVRSTTYRVYVAIMPSDTIAGGHRRYNRFDLAVCSAGANGKISKTPFNKSFTNIVVDYETKPDYNRPDTIYVGDVTFPVAYAGIDGCYPMIKLEGKRSSWDDWEFDYIDNRIRLMGIILRPVEYDEYLKKDE